MDMVIIQQLISDLWNLFLNIFFPKYCLGCGKCGSLLCFSCAGEIEKVKTPTCFYCGKITPKGKLCLNCRSREKSELSGIIICAHYQAGPVKEMIHQFKYGGLTELSEILGELVVLRLKIGLPTGSSTPGVNRIRHPRGDPAGRANLVVVPVPLHKKRQGYRGFNQSELLARYISERLNLPGGLALARTKNTDPQVGKSGMHRKTNLKSAFEVGDADLIFGKTVLLIDDVATTGSTLNECAKVLKSAGAKTVWGVVISRG